jgi:phosphatidylserine/phosphatidylglycerophosphate/cardiolipin synthase-like enzyme
MAENASHQVMATEARILAKTLPYPIMLALADSVIVCDLQSWPLSKSRIVQDISHPHYRSLAVQFLDKWQSQASEVSPQSVALTLLTAAHCERAYQEAQIIELVWTGPDVGCIPLRRTEQALLQVVDSAVQRLVVVSYAVYNIPRICEAIVKAAERGVSIRIIVETPHRLEGENTYNTLKALGSAVARSCSVFFWPLDKRKRDTGGKPGILHVKCAVADGRWLFLSSANLTEYAFTLNMELGLLMTGGVLPGQVEKHFDRMIETKVLVRV